MRLPWFFSQPKRIDVAHSAINGPLAIGQSYGHKTLFASHVPQSGGEFVYMWNKVLDNVKQSSITVHTAVVLGVGTGTAPTIIAALFPKAKVTGVDIDPVIVAVAKKHFGLPTNTVFHVDIADATEWVKEKRYAKKYDLIVVDLFIQALNPASARTKIFLINLKNLLTPGGIIIYNSQYQKNDLFEHKQFLTRCSNIYSSVSEIFSYPLNKVLLFR